MTTPGAPTRIETATTGDVAAPRDRFVMWLAGIFVLALAVRVFHVLQIRSATFFALKMGDSGFFYVWAQDIAGGDWLGSEVFWYAPLYPYFLGALYTVVGDDPLVVRLCQAVIGAVSCVLLAGAGRRFFTPSAGAAAGVIAALYAPAIFYDGLIHKPVLVMLFLCLMLWILGGLEDRPRRAWAWMVLGLAVGGLILTRENTMVFVTVVLAWLFLRHRGVRLPRIGYAALFIAGLAVVLLPVLVRNRVVGGEFHLTAANFGDNFYKGNNPTADGSYRPLRQGRGSPLFERQDATEIAERAAGRTLAPSEVSRYWTGRSLHYITSQPLDWLLLMLKKFVLLTNAVELLDSEDMYTHADASAPLRWTVSVAHLGFLAPLALVGIWITWSRRERLWVLYLMLGLYAATVLMFYVFGRYRYPVVPFLVLFAAAGVTELWDRAPLRRPIACLACVAAVAVLCNWSVREKDPMRAQTHVNMANEFVERGRLEEAIPLYVTAIRLDARHAGALHNLGKTCGTLGRPDEAVRAFERALALDPRHQSSLINLGVLRGKQGNFEAAAEHFKAVLKFDPTSVEAHGNLATTYRFLKRYDESIHHGTRAVELTRGRNARALGQLAESNAAAGQWDRAVEVAGAALTRARESGDIALSKLLERQLDAYRQRRSTQTPTPATAE